MPVYTLSGRKYNIPDDIAKKFESDNPSATQSYHVGRNNYEIPVSKREGFLKKYPDAQPGYGEKRENFIERGMRKMKDAVAAANSAPAAHSVEAGTQDAGDAAMTSQRTGREAAPAAASGAEALPAGDAAGTVGAGTEVKAPAAPKAAKRPNYIERTMNRIREEVTGEVGDHRADAERGRNYSELMALAALPDEERKKVLSRKAGEDFDAAVREEYGTAMLSQHAGQVAKARQEYIDEYNKAYDEQMPELQDELKRSRRERAIQRELDEKYHPERIAGNYNTRLQQGETMADYQERMELRDKNLRRRGLAEREADVDAEFADIDKEEQAMRERYLAAESKDNSDKWGGFTGSLMNAVMAMGTTPAQNMNERAMWTRQQMYNPMGLSTKERDPMEKVLDARRKIAEDRQQFLDDVMQDMGKDYNAFSGMGRAVQAVTDVATKGDTWDFGERDMNTQLAIGDVVRKAISGEQLDDNEKKLLDSWATATAMNGQYGDEISGWTKAGMVTGAVPPFMLEMVMNPASGLGKSLTKGLIKQAVKRYGSKVVRDQAKSLLAKRIATRAFGDVMGASIMSATTGMARVASDYSRRVTGDVVVGQDENGDIIYNGVKDAESPGAALFKAMASQTKENWSEMAGEYLGFINSFFGKTLGKTVIGKAGRKMLKETGSIEGAGLNKAQKFIYDLAAKKGMGAFNEALGQFMKKTQWHGVANEYLEEVIGNVVDASMIGDMEFSADKDKGIFNLEQNIDTFCGVALMGGFMSAMNTVGYAAHRYNYDVDRVSKANEGLFGSDAWEDVKTMIDNSISDPRELNDALTYLLRGKTEGVNGKEGKSLYTADEKKAILKYTQAALEKQGGEMANYQPRMVSTTRQQVSDGENPSAQWEVTSFDKFGGEISKQRFDSEDEAIAYEGELKMRQQSQDMRDYMGMTNKISFGEAAGLIDEFLASNGLDESALADINDPKSDLGRQFREFKNERTIEKAQANRRAIEQFEEEHGWEAGTVQWLSEQDPMELDNDTLQMADEARTFLEGLAYPPTEVHEEHDAEKGAEAAQALVEEVTDSESLVEPENNAGAEIRQQYDDATARRDAAFAANETLKEEVESKENSGLSAQEIVSSLETFRPDEVQAVIDYYNAKAKYDGFMNEGAEQIANAAHSSRERHTFKGTIDGKADLSGVHTITDGTNRYYLVSGDVTTDPATGRITGSTSGLIIGMDEEGNFVKIGDGDGYSVEPVTQSLDQFEEQERIKLEEQVSAAMGGAEETTEGNAGAEAGAEGTGGDEALAPSSVEGAAMTSQPTEQEGQTAAPEAAESEPAGESAGTVASVESVTDENGVKRYENGVSAEDAVADMVASGDNPIEVADASIAEADEIINKINNKPAKTRKDLEERKKAQKVKDYYEDIKNRYVHEDRANGTSYTQIGDRAILEKDGKIIYDTAGKLAPVPPAGAMDAPKEYADATPFIDQINKATSKKKADEILNAAIQAGVNPSEIQAVHTQKVSDIITKEEERRKQENDVTDADRRAVMEKGGTAEGRATLLDGRKGTPEKRRKLAKLIYGDYFDDDFEAVRDVKELISQWLSKGRMLDPDTFGQELGWDMGVGKDAAKVSTMFAARKQNGGDGMTFNDFVHMVWEASGGRFDTDEIRNELIGMFQGAMEKSDLTEYQLKTRIAEAESRIAGELEEAERAAGESENEAATESQQTEPLSDGGLAFGPHPEGEERPAFLGETEEDAQAESSEDNDESSPSDMEKERPSGEAEGTGVQSNEEYLASHPLTEEQIMADTEATEDEKLNAIDFLKGEDDSAISRFYYDSIYNRSLSPIPSREGEGSSMPAAETPEGAVVLEKPETWVGKTFFTNGMQLRCTGVENGYATFDNLNTMMGMGFDVPKVQEWMRNGEWAVVDESGQQKAAAEAVAKRKEEKPKQEKRPAGEAAGTTTDPMEAIEKAAAAFREEQKAKDQADIDAALQEFNDFLDKAKGSSVLDKFMRKGLEGNDKAQASLLDAFTLTNEAQRMFLKDLLRLASKVGYAYIKSGVHDVQAWSRKMSDTIGRKLNEVLGWDDGIVGEFVDEVWNQKYTVDGQRMRLSEHAERLKNNKGADNAVNVNKNVLPDENNVVSSQQEASEEKPKTKDGWLKKMNDVFKELCEKYGLPEDPIILNQWGGRYNFDYRITKGYRLEQFEPYYEAYKKKLDDEVEPATDKQLALIDRLAEKDEKEMLHSIKLNKASASYVISILKAAEDAITNRMSTADVFEEYANELEKVAKLHGWKPKEAAEEKLEGDSAEFADRQRKIDGLSKAINDALFDAVMKGDVKLKTMQNVKALAKEHGLEDISTTDLQELVETEIVNVARDIAATDSLNDAQKFENIKRLYENQPTLSARDNDRINKQQYSTPAPMAFLMGRFVNPSEKRGAQLKGLEPSAGNGMLTIGLPKEGMHVNDIDEMRLSNLAKQGFAVVTSQDGTQPFEPKAYDVVVTNPPFGSVTPKVYDGLYEMSGLEHQMAVNALESMKDDGRAAIIIGGNTEYNTNGTIKGKDRVFLNYLYSHYNVVDVINIDGKSLYAKQGTGYPVRMILINGRKDFNPNSFAPVQSKARAEQVKSYDELYKRVNDDILSNENKPASVHDTEGGKSNGKHDNGNAGNVTQTGVRNGGKQASVGEHQPGNGGGQRVSGSTPSTKQRPESEENSGVDGRAAVAHGSGSNASEPSGAASSQANQGGGLESERRDDVEQSSGGNVPAGRSSELEKKQAQKRSLGTEKVPYSPQSGNPFTLQSQMPAEQAETVKKSLEDLGDVDQFLVDELGYANKEDLHRALAAEQIDSVALAIHQMKNGDAFIIGDQTGIGKGRQGAALIRWAVKNGKCPVYFTAKPELFSSVYRDIKDIGSDGLRPFILASDKTKARIVEDKNGKMSIICDLPTDKEQKRVIEYINKNGKLPPEYDFVITTYSQVGNGTMEYENGQKKARSYSKNKTATKADLNGQSKRDAIESLAGNSVVIMDESHLAGGESARGNFLQYISTKAQGITYISATFAKRPDNMPIYSLRTAISKAGVKIGELIDAVKRGGATFQEIMSKALTEAGQMIRRERDMTGVTVDWKGIEDEDVIKRHYEQYDKIIGLFNDIIDFQHRYVDPIVNKMNDDAADSQGAVDHTPGTRDMGINNTPFASQTHQIVKQVLLSLKAAEGAKFAIECLKNDEKPVICVENTNEGAADKAVGDSDEDMEMPDLSVNLKKGLQGTMRISTRDAFGNSTKSEIPFSKLSPEGRARYQEIMDAIDNASTGLSLSPIDIIKNEIRKAGYSIAELTGRKKEFIFNDDGTVRRVNRTDTDNKKNASDFNNGRINAVIINKSAGTGIDLHAGIKFDNTDQRHMIVVQAQSDINDEVQMRGRTDRTGQKQHSKYTYIVSTIPSEQRLLMMLKAKLRSLDANTTSSQKSKFNEMQVQDIINKYGDEIVIQYLAEHPDLAAKMNDPLKWGEGFDMMSPELLIANASKANGGDGATASKVLGRMALLTVKEQEKMLAEIGEMYQAEIDRLNEMGENDLEITEMPLKAKTLKKNVWEEGVEPGGKNPFADNSYVEEVEMDVLKKPMKGDEVRKAQERLLGGKAPSTAAWEAYKQEQLDKVNKWADEKKEETRKTFTERAEKKAKAEQEKYVKGAKKAQEKNGMTDAEIERNGQQQYETFYNQEMEKLNTALTAVDRQKNVFVDALELFTTEGTYALPKDIYDLSQLTFEPSFGKVIDIKIADNFSTNASTITFATLDGRRKITIPINGMVKQNNGEKQNIIPSITSQTSQSRDGFFGSNVANTYKVLSQSLDNWDKLTSTATRKKGYIITGNLLKALTSLRSQGKGGKLISYTTDTGEIRQGILMSDNFDPKGLTSKNPISSKKDELKYSRDKVESSDGEVVVRVTGDWDWGHGGGYNTLELSVPGSKKKGDKFFNDETLLSLMNGQFEGKTKMKAEFKRENLDAVMKRLDELGVTVEGEAKTDDGNGGGNNIATNGTRRYDEDIEEGEAATESQQTGQRERIAEHVDALVEKLGTKERTKVYRSLDEVPEDERKYIEERHRQGRKVRGWYENGEVHLFLPDIESEHQAEKTLWHETVAHHGLRQLIGDENLDKLLRHLWLEHKDGDMGTWVTKRMEQNGWRLNEAIEEYLAREAEEHPFEQPSLWQRLRWMLADVLHKMGFATDPTISDIQYLFWVSQNRLREGDALSKIKQQAFLHRLERAAAMTPHRQTYVNMYAERVEDIYNPEAEGAYPDGETIRHSEETGRRHDEDIEEPLEVESAKDLYNERVDTAGFIVTEAYQDSMLALKTAQNAIVKDGEIPDSQNAYMAENLMHGKNKNEQDLFNLEYRDPIIDTVNEILNKMGWTMRRMNQYLLTKSGLERNRELFVRDWLERQRKTLPHAYEELNDDEKAIYDRKAARIEQDFDDGTIDEAEKEKRLEAALVEAHQEYIDGIENEWQTLKDHLYSGLKVNLWGYLKGLDAFIEGRIDDEYDPSKNDYSGLTEIYGGQFDDEEAINDVMNDEAINDVMNDEDAMGLTPDGNTSGTVDKLWDKIHAASRYGLERYREAGMRSDEEIDKIEQMFHWYVPMRGFDKDTGEDMYQYFTSARKANSYVGGLIKRAKGRKSRSKAPLASLFAMTYKAIGDCNQNLVNQHLYRLCQAHPNDLVVLSDAWAVLNETTGLWEEAYPTIPDDASAEEIRQITLAFEDEMRRKAVEGTAKKLNGKGRIDYAPADKKKRDEHIVEVRMNGRKKRMTFVGNPRAAQALNGHTRFERNHNPISNVNNWIKNKMAGAFTSFSPTFALRNMMRDWTHFRMMLGVREGQGYAHAAHKYYKETFPRPVHTRGKEGIKSLFKKYRAGTLDMNKEVERDFKDFMDNGGITGFVQMQKIEDIEKEMEKVNKQLNDGKAVKLNSKLWDFTLGAIEAYNEAIENNARFATYRASRHYAGRTKARSAYDAKEITVNFNRRGSGSKASGFKSERDKVVAAARAAGLTSQVFGEGRLFFNATVQAIATTFKNFKNPDGTLNKKYISRWAGMYALPPFAFGMLLPYINMALAAMLGGDDDDPYANLPDWVRRKNLCIYIGNDNFITIPVGQELSSFLALGDIAASRLYAPNLESADKSINEEIVDALNSFSPVDINTKVTKGGLFSKDWLAEAAGKTFSVLTPVISVASNRSWTGRPIFREDRFDSDKYTPEYQKVYSGTNQVLVDAMKKLHELGGGDDAMRGKLEVNPAIVQYLWEQYTGGPGKMFSNAISLGRDVKDLVTEGAAEDFNVRKVEGLKAFVQQGDDRTQYYRTLAKYRKYREDADKLYDAMNGYKKLADTDPTYYLKLEELSKGVDAVRMNIVREAEKELRKINKAANMAEGAERKELRRQYNEAVKEVVDMLDEVSL